MMDKKDKKYITDKADKTEITDNSKNIIYGRNAVIELLKGEEPAKCVDRIFIKSGVREGSLRVIEALALKAKIPMVEAGAQKLDELAGGGNHQGVAAVSAEKEYVEIEDILAIAQARGEKPFVVIADGIEDPYNLGALIRSAECAGVHGIIIPKRRSVGLTASVAKASAGALGYMAVARVPNLAAAVDKLKECGLWIYAAEAGGMPYYECDMNSPAALIMGGEDSGVSKLLLDKCDFKVSIPLHGQINSLNVSAAAAVIMNEISMQHYNNCGGRHGRE